MKWRFGPLSVLEKAAEEEPLLELQVGLHVLTMNHFSLKFIVCSFVADQSQIQMISVTTHSITLVPSPPSGTVYYKEVGSSAPPRHAPYSDTVTIAQLQPNTEYNITYVTGNGLGVNRAEVRQFTLPTGK